MRMIVCFALIATLVGCGVVRNTAGAIGVGSGSAKRSVVEVEGVKFRARANSEKEDRRNFTITVTPAAGNPKAAVAAGRYQATRFCLLTFGGSDTDWTVGPDTPIDELRIADNTLTLQGRCTQR